MTRSQIAKVYSGACKHISGRRQRLVQDWFAKRYAVDRWLRWGIDQGADLAALMGDGEHLREAYESGRVAEYRCGISFRLTISCFMMGSAISIASLITALSGLFTVSVFLLCAAAMVGMIGTIGLCRYRRWSKQSRYYKEWIEASLRQYRASVY